MKRVFAAILLSGVIALSIAGCSSGTNAGTTDSASSADQTAQQEPQASDSQEPEQAEQPEPQPAEPLDLTGEWRQANEGAAEAIHIATISDGEISIDWLNEAQEAKSVYWKGTYIAPTEATDSYSWTSEKTLGSEQIYMLASQEDSKDFTYENGQIVYETSAMGTTWTVRLERVS